MYVFKKNLALGVNVRYVYVKILTLACEYLFSSWNVVGGMRLSPSEYLGYGGLLQTFIYLWIISCLSDKYSDILVCFDSCLQVQPSENLPCDLVNILYPPVKYLNVFLPAELLVALP